MNNNGQRRYDLLDQFARSTLTSYESRVIFVILKWHLIYNNGGVMIAISRICDITGLDHGSVCRAIRGLIQKKLLTKTQKNRLNFYSITSAIQPSAVEPTSAIQPSAVEPQNVAIQPRDYKNNSNEVKNNIAGSADQSGKFTDQYPGSWYQSVKARAEKIFAGMSPEDRQKALKALSSYKSSKAVKDGKIFSPVNFLKDAEIIDRYAKESAPPPPAPPISPETIDEWRREQEKDPFKGSLMTEFKKVVEETAASKSATKGGK